MQRCQIKDNCGIIVYWKSDEFDSSKDTIFFLHGLTANHTMFDQQIPWFEQQNNMITWDAPAHGESRPYTHFTYENAAHAVKQIMDECGVSQLILAGQSMGGFISQSFIFRYPESVKAFISIDSTPYGDYYSRSDQWWLKQVEWMAELYPDKLLRSSMAKLCAITGTGRQNMISMLSGYTKKELCHLMGIGFAGFLEDNRVMDIPCPVLLIMGEKDTTGKVKTYNKEWTKRTGYPLVWIKNAAHNANVDQPETVNQCITDFLKSNLL
ncbi:MAG: alpha/beta hydrolase [Solobacterium sp.]|nr:alpha/beta hydrolase [Solobacterium sp.]